MAKVALLIGVSEYEPGLNPLPGAVRDVEAIQEVLLHAEIGGFASADVKLLKNPERQEMEEAIEALFSGRMKDDLVLLYFSGHGIKDDSNRLYLTTRTTRKTERGELVRSTAVAASFVHDSMGRSRSKRQVVVLDSCFSGAFAEGLLARDDGAVDIRTELGGEGRAVLTSSTSTQYSFEEKGEDLSIYTRFLLEGIKTGAADLDDDGVISIDELHEYASRKVQELQPAMKPELYAIREGFKIRLTKVPPGDPLQKYRKEVARFIHRGEISFVGRRTLDVLRSRLTLEPVAAQAIEDEVLEPYRQEFRNKLQQYEQVFAEVLQRDQTITEGDRADLQNLQQILGLRNEDTVPIEAAGSARFKAHQQNLQTYERTFEQALRREFPLSEVSRTRMAELKRQLELGAEVLPIEARITAEVEVYYQNLQRYEQLFIAAIQRRYPFSDEARNELQQQRERFGLSEADVAPIEAKITAEIETYQQKLQQYEQAYVKATKRRHHLSEGDRTQLERTWRTLGLREEDVRAIVTRINAEVESYQANLRQYEHEFAEAVQQQYPLSEGKRRELKQQQQGLSLMDEDIAPIQSRITVSIEEVRHKREQYRQVLAEAIQFEYPLSDTTRDELRRFQNALELSNKEIEQIEEQVIKQPEVTVEETAQIKQQRTKLRIESPLQEALPNPTEHSKSSSERIEASSLASTSKNSASKSVISKQSNVSLASSSSQNSLPVGNKRRVDATTSYSKKQVLLTLCCVVAIASVSSVIYNRFREESIKAQQPSVSIGSTPSASIQSSSDPQVIAREKKLPLLKGEAIIELVVRKSTITIKVDGINAPITAGNFVDLVDRGVYNGLPFHRVVKEPQPFVVQGGDPQGKDPEFPLERLGTGSYIDPATFKPRYIPLEIKPEDSTQLLYDKILEGSQPKLRHTRGAVASARQPSLLESGSSQFYIALSDLDFLDGSYAVFGYVTRGMDVVELIQQGDRIESAKVISGLENLQR
jgi:cyclophilin family peptidyl-prolyl cis-trans isomerase